MSPTVDGNFVFDILPSVDVDPGAVVGATAVRVHADFLISSGPPQNTLAGAFFALAVMEREVGAETLPSPMGWRNHVDWMHWEFVPLAMDKFATTQLGEPVTAIGAHYRIDVKSARIFTSPKMSLLAHMQILNWAATPAASGICTASTLIKLA